MNYEWTEDEPVTMMDGTRVWIMATQKGDYAFFAEGEGDFYSLMWGVISEIPDDTVLLVGTEQRETTKAALLDTLRAYDALAGGEE